MNQSEKLLDKLVKLASGQKNRVRLKAIFDLDSTLFDVSPRIARILNDFALLPEMKAGYPKECEILGSVVPDIRDYGVRKTLARYAFEWPNEEFGKTLIEYWKHHFFSNRYLKYDVPYPGTREFTVALFEAGADILYLTGRDVPRMLEGTLKSLREHGFPLDANHTNVILKPDSNTGDSLFKKDFFEKMEHSQGPVWFFENEPINIHLVSAHCPHIKVVFVETVHSGKAPPPEDHVPRITWGPFSK